MTTTQTTACTSQRQAIGRILTDLGHASSGSMAAQLDQRMIQHESDEDRTSEVYTHPNLPGREYLVGWEHGV